MLMRKYMKRMNFLENKRCWLYLLIKVKIEIAFVRKINIIKCKLTIHEHLHTVQVRFFVFKIDFFFHLKSLFQVEMFNSSMNFLSWNFHRLFLRAMDSKRIEFSLFSGKQHSQTDDRQSLWLPFTEHILIDISFSLLQIVHYCRPLILNLINLRCAKGP